MNEAVFIIYLVKLLEIDVIDVRRVLMTETMIEG